MREYAQGRRQQRRRPAARQRGRRVTDDGCDDHAPGAPTWTSSSPTRSSTCEEYAERQRPVIEAEKASWRHPEIDVLKEMKRRIEPLLDESIYLAKGVGGPVRFDLVGYDGESVESIVVDFPGKEVRPYADEKVRYRFRTERALVEHLLHIDEVRLGQLAVPVLPLLRRPDRPVQRVRLRVLQVPVRGAAAVRRGLVRRARAHHRRRGHHARRLGRAAALPAPQGRPDPVRHRRRRHADLPAARLEVRPAPAAAA